MAAQKPAKLNTSTGKISGFESGDFVSVDKGGTGLTTTAANTVLVSDTLDTISARALDFSDITGDFSTPYIEFPSTYTPWSTAGWPVSASFVHEGAAFWPIGGGGSYSFGLIKSGDILYFLRSTADDNSAASTNVMRLNLATGYLLDAYWGGQAIQTSKGGTGTDLSVEGPGWLRQDSFGATVTVRELVPADIADLEFLSWIGM